MSFHVVIPARFASTRLPGKPLLDIRGKTMVRHVADACERSLAADVFIATDHPDIAAQFRVAPQEAAQATTQTTTRSSAVMTRASHVSGTDRVAEVAQLKGWAADEIVVNVQGDEPQIPPSVINQVAKLLCDHPKADLATLCTPITSLDEFLDPNVVKVTVASDQSALYFSRAPIPWSRDTAELGSQQAFPAAHRHLGIYAYRVGALLKLTQLSQSMLEQIEKLEQLRALQAGMRIVVAPAVVVPGPGIDTAADLERARHSH